jgi:2'-5' RNA ligase
MTDAPLILTLALDTESQQFFNLLRKLHFPSERNYLDAHLTLFHHLPQGEDAIIQTIENYTKQYQKMQIQVTGLRSIGNGVAFSMESSQLQQMHKQLQNDWQPWLIPQDRQKLWPHITIQNKVKPEEAKKLKETLEQGFEPFSVTGVGLNLFEYLGGPWKFVKEYEFNDKL